MDIMFIKVLVLFLFKYVSSPLAVPPLQNNAIYYGPSHGNYQNANNYYPPTQEESVFRPFPEPFLNSYATDEPVHQTYPVLQCSTNQCNQIALYDPNLVITFQSVFPKNISHEIKCNKKTETTILNFLQKLCTDIFLNKKPDYVSLMEIFHKIAHLESIPPIVFGLLTILRASSYNIFLMSSQSEWNTKWPGLCLAWTKDFLNYPNENRFLLDEEIKYITCIEEARKNLCPEFPLKPFVHARDVKVGESIPRRHHFIERVSFMLIKDRYLLYERFLNEIWSPLLLNYTFNFLVIDNWQNYWVVATPSGTTRSVLIAIGVGHGIPYQVSDGYKVWQTAMIGDKNNIQIILQDNLIEKRHELYYNEINLDSFLGKISNLSTPFFILSSTCIGTFSFLFFSLFIANWTGHCDKCHHHAVKFFGVLFHSLFGGILGYMMINIISFNEGKLNSNVIKYKHYISKNLLHGNTITKHIYSSRKNAEEVSKNKKFIFICLVAPAFVLLIWPLICINVVLTKGENLIFFFSGLSFFIAWGLVGALYKYINMVKEENCRIKEDSGIEPISFV